MAVLRIKDDNGNIIDIPAIKGDKGDKGDGLLFVNFDGHNLEHPWELPMGSSLSPNVHKYSLFMFQIAVDGSCFNGDYERFPANRNTVDVFALKWTTSDDVATEIEGRTAVMIHDYSNDTYFPAQIYVSFMINKETGVTFSDLETGALVITSDGAGDAKIVGMQWIA